MRRALHASSFLVVIALVMGGAALEGSDWRVSGLEPTEGHSHHPDSEQHQHGDGDDQHDGPESPCHHHDTHCCCTHVGQASAINVSGGLPDCNPILSRVRIAVETIIPEQFLKNIFHPPRT